MKISEEKLNDVLDKVASSFAIKNWSYIRNDIDETIENYFGIIVPVTLIGTDNGGEIRKPLFIKFAPVDDEKLKFVIQQHYEVEEYAYCTVFPTYKRISNVNIDKFIPECFYADLEPNNQVIVLKDMRSEGFERYDKQGFFDAEHVRSCLETLATYHALSIIFKKNGGDFDNVITKPYTDKHILLYFLHIEKTLKTKSYLFNETIYERYLRRLTAELATIVASATTEARYLVYGHGDFWKENILFKYEKSKPVQVCLVDFQKMRRMSPALDILIFLLTSVAVTDIDRHHKYLNIYLEKFQQILEENDLECTYSFDDLNHDMKVVAPYVFAITFMSFSLWLGVEGDNVLKCKNVSDNPDENSIVFKNTITDILEELNTFGYIEL